MGLSPSEAITVTKPPARALLGSTGSGKTPLGELLARSGLAGTTCMHFDFGENLRQIVRRNQPDEIFPQTEIDFLHSVLDAGALLEDEHFSIAERILRSFLTLRRADENSLVLLNGLPRHVGQADAVGNIVDVQSVVHLACSPETVVARIGRNTGGDRGDRIDDEIEAVRNKLELYSRFINFIPKKSFAIQGGMFAIQPLIFHLNKYYKQVAV